MFNWNWLQLFWRLRIRPHSFPHYMNYLIRWQLVVVHKKCNAISVSRPHMFTAPSGVPPESESVSSNVCSQQPLLLSCSGYWGLHKLNWHAVWKWPPISVCVLLLLWFLSLPDNWSLSISKDLHHGEPCFALSLKTHMGCGRLVLHVCHSRSKTRPTLCKEIVATYSIFR